MKVMTNAIHAEKTSPLVNDEIIFYNEEPRDLRDFFPWPSFTFAGDTPADGARKELEMSAGAEGVRTRGISMENTHQ